MGRPRRVHCKQCGRHIDDVGPLSARGLCEADSVGNMTQAVNAMHLGSGPIYSSWADGMQKAAARARAKLVSDDDGQLGLDQLAVGPDGGEQVAS